MTWNSISDRPCSIARALSVVGERWTLLLIREAFAGARRFDEFRVRLGISRNVLTVRLQALVESEVLERVSYQDSPRRWEYRLTEKGRDLYPVLLGLMHWGDRWQAGSGGAPLLLVHGDHEARPALTCSHCGDALTPESVRPRLPARALAQGNAPAPTPAG